MGEQFDGQRSTRRTFLRCSAGAAAAIVATSCGNPTIGPTTRRDSTQLVNDVHSRINPTSVSSIEYPSDLDELTRLVKRCSRERRPISICGGRHSAGGQQFLSDRMLVDSARLCRMLRFDQDAHQIEFEAGARWPQVFDVLHSTQRRRPEAPEWTIHQKQGGADLLTLGGAVGSNVHGRGLNSKPIIQDIVQIKLVDSSGELLTCSRRENYDLFRLAVGGYGLFGCVYSVTLQLVPRQKLVRRVRWAHRDDVVKSLEQQQAEGAVHGDFQFSVDERADHFMREGLLSWYVPAPPLGSQVREQTPQQAVTELRQLLVLAHQDKSKAFEVYRQSTLATDGQIDWLDSWQSGVYAPGYHELVDAATRAATPGTELLAEIYVPRQALPQFLTQAAEVLRSRSANLIYGNVRLIRRDAESFLAWAKQDYACVIMNLHAEMDSKSIANTGETFRALFDIAIALNGSYYLTYHRFARKDQVLASYPQMPDFLRAKRRFDPRELFQSDWYRFYRDMFLG